MDDLARFLTETDYFFLNLVLLMAVGVILYSLQRREFAVSTYLERLIWSLLVSNVVLLAVVNFFVCSLNLSVFCPVSFGSILLGSMFWTPDLWFLSFCSGMYLLFSRKSEGLSEENFTFPFDLNSLFVSGTLLVLLFGLVWRYGLMMVQRE
jgi:hypothetical protein